MENLEAISKCVVEGDLKRIEGTIKNALEKGIKPITIINDGLIMGMNEVGKSFKNGELFVPEVLRCAKVLNTGLNILKPMLQEKEYKPLATVVMCTVKGDVHDVGKNLVSMIMEGAGFKVIDIGIDVSKEEIAKAIERENPDILGMSALLTITMPAMKESIKYLEKIGLREKVKIIIGGAPVTKEFAEAIGADGYASDAINAVDIAKEIMNGGRHNNEK